MAKFTVRLKNYLNIFKEKVAVAAITPGMIIERTSADKYQAHSTAGGNVTPVVVAIEDELQGNGIDDAYSADDQVQAWYPQSGDEGYCILADGENVVIGDDLESNGAGYLRAHADGSAGELEYPRSIVAIALETADLSDSSGGESSGALGYNKRIKVEFV